MHLDGDTEKNKESKLAPFSGPQKIQCTYFFMWLDLKQICIMATNPSPSSLIPVGLNFLFPNFESKV